MRQNFQSFRGFSATIALRLPLYTVQFRIRSKFKRKFLTTNELNGKRVAILVAHGFERAEMTPPREALEKAGALAYLDMFQLFAIAALLVVPLVWFTRKVTATKEVMAAH